MERQQPKLEAPGPLCTFSSSFSTSQKAVPSFPSWPSPPCTQALPAMKRSEDGCPLQVWLLGPRGAGKSAVAGKVLCEGGPLEPRTLQRLQRQTEKGDQTHAQLLTCLQGGQESGPALGGQGRHYRSRKYELSIASAPDCREGLGSVFSHRAQSACVLLLVSAAGEDFEASRALLKDQVSFASKLRLRQLVVCVNKMDATDPPYDSQRYETIVHEISVDLWGLGRNPNYVVFLPISALHGDNIRGPSQAMPWFPGWEIIEEAGGALRGFTLQQLLDAVVLKFRPDSCYTKGVWSQEEEKCLLLAWKDMTNPASSGAPCPHALSSTVMCAGIRRSPEQCRTKANFLLNRYIAARLQGSPGNCPFSNELHAILAYEAAQFMLQLEKLQPGLRVPAVRTVGVGGPASQASTREEAEPVSTGPSQHWESLLAGLGIHPERPQRTPEGRGCPALLECLRPPSGWRDHDPDFLLTGLEIKRCERLAWPAGGQRAQGAVEGASSEGCRCLVYRTAYFAMKQKEAEPASGPQAEVDIPLPLAHASQPPEGRCPLESPLLARCPPCPEQASLPTSLLPSQWGCWLPLLPVVTLVEPVQRVDFPCLSFPAALPMLALEPLQLPLESPCYEPAGPAHALLWPFQRAHAYAPLVPVGQLPSSQPMPEAPCDRACLGDEHSPAQPGPPDAAAGASLLALLSQVAPAPGPLIAPLTTHWEPAGPCHPPLLGTQLGLSAADSLSPSAGASVWPLLPRTHLGNGLGSSTMALLSSLAQLSPAFQLLYLPGTPLPLASPPLVVHAGMFPLPQLQCLLGSGLHSPPGQCFARLTPARGSLPRSPLSCALPFLSPTESPHASGSTSPFLNCRLVGTFCRTLPTTGLV